MKTKILIVDDSLVSRRIIEESLAGEDDVQVVGAVRDGEKAMTFIRSTCPDLVTLDVEMPGMDGLETLRAIQEFNRSRPDSLPIGVIMVSAFTEKNADITIKSLEAGAFDFITKPKTASFDDAKDMIRRQLLLKIRYFRSVRISKILSHNYADMQEVCKTSTADDLSVKSIQPFGLCIGVSTGGPNALGLILPRLCEHLIIPIFIVQHMPPEFTQSLAKSLNSKCRYNVIEAKNGDIVCDNYAYIAPGDYHMLIRRKGINIITVTNQQPPEEGMRPSVNVLFRSVAHVYGKNCIALILTGMGADGSHGLSSIKRAGGYVIAQDESSSVVWGMPGSAVASGFVDEVLPLEQIPEVVIQRVNKAR